MEANSDTTTKACKWNCTLNNPFDHGVESIPEFLENFYTKLKCMYVNGQYEKAPTTGTPHIQFYVHLKNPIRKSQLIKINDKATYRVVKQDNGASSYCLK